MNRPDGRHPMLASRLQLLGAAALFSTGGAAIKACALDGLADRLLPRRDRGPGRRRAVIFIQAASPLFIAALGPWLIGERLRPRDAPFMAALIVGLALFFAGALDEHATAPNPRLGNALAAASSFTVALMMMGPFSLHVMARPADAAILAYLGVFQIGLAYPPAALGAAPRLRPFGLAAPVHRAGAEPALGVAAARRASRDLGHGGRCAHPRRHRHQDRSGARRIHFGARSGGSGGVRRSTPLLTDDARADPAVPTV